MGKFDLNLYRKMIEIAIKLSEISFNCGNSEAVSAAFLLKGECHQQISEQTEAEQSYSLSLGSSTNSQSTDPRISTQARIRLALLYLDTEQYGFARDHYREATSLLEYSLDPVELAEAHIGFARLEAEASSFASAAEHLSHAESILSTAQVPGLPSLAGLVQLQTGQMQLYLNRYLKAIDHLQVAIPMLTAENRLEAARCATISLGTALEAVGRGEDAVACFKTALEGMAPAHPSYQTVRSKAVHQH